MSTALRKSDRYFFRSLIGALLLFGVCASAYAAAPMSGIKESPGYYRMMLGQFEITALYDGSVGIDRKILQNASDAEIQNLLARMFVTSNSIETATNAYLINTGSRLVLVDAGAARLFGPTLGNVLKNLRASGYEPSQVDAVLITHLHGDHMGGLLDDQGKPVFANATVYVARAESDFYLSPAVAEKAPAAYQPYFKMARDTAAPYVAAGKWNVFDGDALPIAGIKALAIPGHTTGHTAYEVKSGDQTLLIWGDLIHSLPVQFSNPDVSAEYDMDRKQAVASRKTILQRVAGKTLVAGMHMPFPGIGMVQADGNNKYLWVPAAYFRTR